MADGFPELELSYKDTSGDEMFLGLQCPEPGKMPLSFAEFPAEDNLTIDELKFLYGKKNKTVMEWFKRVKSQGRKSSCASYATTTGCEIVRKIHGKEDFEYGPEHLYSMVNGGSDRGSMLDDNMVKMVKVGCAGREVIPYQVHRMPNFSMEEKNAVEREAKGYRVLDYLKLPHGNIDTLWPAMISAIAKQNIVLLAVHCGPGFFKCGADGIYRADRGGGNHAVCGAELHGVMTAKSYRDIGIWTLNSHGRGFGKKGWYLHTYEHSIGPAQYHLHGACRSMRTSPDEKSATLLAA